MEYDAPLTLELSCRQNDMPNNPCPENGFRKQNQAQKWGNRVESLSLNFV